MSPRRTKALQRGRRIEEPSAPAPLGRPRKDLKPAMFKLRPEQHQALSDAAFRARLDRRSNAAEGASFIVRHLVQGWIDDGAEWPEES